MFEEYLSRAEAFRQNNTLILLYVLGGILVAVACAFGGILILAAHYKRRNQNQIIYRPLGLLLVFGFFRVSFEVLAVWRNYAWIISVVTLVWGLIALWFVVSLPTAIRQRRALLETYRLVKAKEDLEKEIERLKAEVKDLLEPEEK